MPDSERTDLLDLVGADAERAWRLAHGLDLQLEACQYRGDTAERTLETVVPWIMEQIGAQGIAIELLGRGEVWKVLHFGGDREELETFVSEQRKQATNDGRLCCLPIDIHDETIGYIAASFASPPPSPGASILLEIAWEELDNVLYELRRARFRHDQVIEVERRLQNHVLEQAIDHTAGYVMAETGASSLAVVYLEDTGDRPRRRCRVFSGQELLVAASTGDESKLGQLLGSEGSLDPTELIGAAGIEVQAISTAVIETGLSSMAEHGFVVATGSERAVTGAELELVQHFAVALGQRLVDYHKDQRYLQQFFSPDTVTRLLSVQNYQQEFLTPRLRDVAILYSDINSFTKISEQILDGPAEVGALIDFWSAGVVDILFKHGGAFDKMVGDCVIGLFGTPFDDLTPEQRVAGALRAAFEICEYTATLSGIPEVDKICASDLIPGLGVATGVHFGNTMVGTFGPNNAFTAFGREMNNAARLQGVAGFREILIMEAARDVLVRVDHPLEKELEWGEVKQASVKNVKDPLSFHSFVFDGGD
ncbi:MAG: adenylate/guanylate cyclase domain-containing protein [Deltaproteobacteria bacterium]|nr:adenylate/guanylate cyclase domain-containing protein [Deltaproteobacteria bacterium]